MILWFKRRFLNRYTEYTYDLKTDTEALYQLLEQNVEVFGIIDPKHNSKIPVKLRKVNGEYECGTVGQEYFSAQNCYELSEMCKKYNFAYFMPQQRVKYS